jgi:arginyl-tRNA synthetase
MNEIEFNLKQALANAAKAAFDAEVVASNVVIEIPKDKNHGDYSSNIAMQLTRVLRNNPRVIAQGLIDHLDKEAASIESVEIAGPGFLNFKMSNASLTSVIDKVVVALL